jgi:hypothetical protein
MNLKTLKFNLPKRWKEVSRSGNENQLIIRIYHVNPLAHVDPKIFQDQPISSNAESSVSKIAVTTPSAVGGSFADFFKGMKGAIDSGFMPSYMTTGWLEDLNKKMTKTPGVEIPDESDITGDITIVQYQTNEIARESFQNYGSFQTGFGMVVPGSGGLSFADLMESDALKSVVSKEQREQMKLMSEKIKTAMPKIKEDIKKTGIKYTKGKFLGYEAIFSEMPNPTPPPKTPVPIKKGTFQGGGSRGNNLVVPLPKISKPYKETIVTCQAVLIKNFVITSGLFGTASLLPSGNTPCYSLTKTEQRKETVEGIKSTYIIAAASNYGNEGYLNKDDVEEVLLSIFSKIA